MDALFLEYKSVNFKSVVYCVFIVHFIIAMNVLRRQCNNKSQV